MLEGFFVPLFVVALAELADKSQLAIIFLSSKTKNHASLLAGVLLAFAIVDGVAILFGSQITNFVPQGFIKMISGMIFLAFGIFLLAKRNSEENGSVQYRSPFISGFSLVFLTEWADKTQISSAIFAARYEPFPVFAGVMVALAALSAVSIYLGKAISRRFDRRSLSIISGAAFIIFGLAFLLI